MPRINKFVPTAGLLIFIMTSVVACGIYTQMVKERVYSLRQSAIDTAFTVTNITEYRRSMAISLINTLNPTEEQLLVGLHTAHADSVPSSYLYDVGPYLISSDECTQVKEFEKDYCADIIQVVKYRHVKNTGLISFDGKTFIYYLHPVTHNRSLTFSLGLERSSLLSKSLATDNGNLMFSLFKSGKSVTGDKYNAKNTIFTVLEAMEHLAYSPAGLYAFAYKEDVYLRVCTLIIFFAALVAVISGTGCLYLVRKVVDHGIVEKEATINNHSKHTLDGGLLSLAIDVKKLYSMYNSVFLDNLTKAIGRRSFDEDLRALPEEGGYLCLFDADEFKNINNTFGYLLGDEVLMRVVRILKSQIPVDKGKVYRFGGGRFVMTHTGGTLEELLSILEEIVHFQVGSISLSTGIGVARSNECPTVERLKMLMGERLYKSKKNDRAQTSWQ